MVDYIDDDFLVRFKLYYNCIKYPFIISAKYLTIMIKIVTSWMFTTLINLLIKFNRRRIIMDRSGDQPYLERYYLLFKERNKFPFNIFLHKFIKGDDELDLHNHPWGYMTIILSGGYWEYQFADKLKLINTNCDNKLYSYQKIIKKWRKPGTILFYNHNNTHRVELAENTETCWTLFIPFKTSTKGWGFFKYKDTIDSELEYIDSNTYLEKKKKNNLNDSISSKSSEEEYKTKICI